MLYALERIVRIWLTRRHWEVVNAIRLQAATANRPPEPRELATINRHQRAIDRHQKHLDR